MEGKGICYFNNGNVYEGEFKNDSLNDQGIYYYKNCDMIIGNRWITNNNTTKWLNYPMK